MDTPWIKQIAPSNGEAKAIVIVTGFLTENATKPYHHRPWIKILRKAGWDGSVYYFWWDSSNKSNSNSVLWQGPGYFNYWEKHKRRAKYSGRYYLEKLISKNLNEDSVSLIGHSLGARVLFFGLRDWSSSSRLKPESVFLLGGAVPKNRKWFQVAKKLKGRLFNIYNDEDKVLKIEYRISSFGLDPCGLRPITQKHPRIVNINVSRMLGSSHDFERYMKTFPTLIQHHKLLF